MCTGKNKCELLFRKWRGWGKYIFVQFPAWPLNRVTTTEKISW